MKSKIGVLTHYSAMESDFSHLAETLDCELVFRLGVMEDAIDTAIYMEQQDHVDAIITRTFTATFIEPYINVPMVTLPKAPYEVLLAIYEAKREGAHKIALVDSVGAESPLDYEEMACILNCELHPYQLKTGKEAGEIIKMVLRDHCDEVVSSAGCMRAQSKAHRIPHSFIKVSEEEMRNAIRMAKNISQLIKATTAKNAYLNTLVDTSITAVFTLDAGGKIEFINEAAENLFHMSKEKLIGRAITEVAQSQKLFGKIIAITNDLDIISADDLELIVNKQDIKPQDGTHLGVVYHLQEAKEAERRELLLRQKVHERGFVANKTFGDIVGHSAPLMEAIEYAKKYAATPSNILITGESGSGKEIFAQSIHNRSGYRAGPFLAINCATLPENLLESELFGYTEGSFTGAKRGGKAGLLELAHEGTLFLDEIGDMPMSLQAKLLRVLQERQVRRIGGEKNQPINVRIISATNRDLIEAVNSGSFRADLYYRINVLSLRIPPLRERKEDLRDLTEAFAKTFSAQLARPIQFSEECYQVMREYDWPGNVREFSNFIERISVLNHRYFVDPVLIRQIMSERDRAADAADVPGSGEGMLHIPIGPIKDMELEIIKQVYHKFGKDKKKTADALGMSSTTFWRRLQNL